MGWGTYLGPLSSVPCAFGIRYPPPLLLLPPAAVVTLCRRPCVPATAIVAHPWVLMRMGGPWHAGRGSAFRGWAKWAGGLTWALLRLFLVVLCVRDSPIPSPFSSWAFGPAYAVFVAFVVLGALVNVGDVAVATGGCDGRLLTPPGGR
jgi:hypothetical protein